MGLFSIDKQFFHLAHIKEYSKRGWMRLSVKVPSDKIEEGLDEVTSVKDIRGLKPNEKNDFAINQTKAFESNIQL